MQDARGVPPDSTLDLQDFIENQISHPARLTAEPRMVSSRTEPSNIPHMEDTQPVGEENELLRERRERAKSLGLIKLKLRCRKRKMHKLLKKIPDTLL